MCTYKSVLVKPTNQNRVALCVKKIVILKKIILSRTDEELNIFL